MKANRRSIAAFVCLLSVTTIANAASPQPASAVAPASQATATAPAAVRQLDIANKPWTGDFDAMLQRRVIRFLVPYSRTLYFNDKGRERGISAELARDFERYINKTYADRLGKRPVTVYLIPATRDKLLTNFPAGLGDISAGNLTVTDEREKIVDSSRRATENRTRSSS